jgi:hypothetical protein
LEPTDIIRRKDVPQPPAEFCHAFINFMEKSKQKERKEEKKERKKERKKEKNK